MKKIYAIHDIKSDGYGIPFFIDTEEMAVREFRTLVQREGTGVNLYPEDYELVYLGDFDPRVAVFETNKTPTMIVKGSFFATKDSQDQLKMVDNEQEG